MTRHIPSCAAGVPVFRVLSPDELEKIGKEMRHRVFRKGEVVVPAGSVVDCLYVVSRGRLNVVHTSASGREQVVRALGPGEFLGEMALFYDSVMEGDVVAAEETETCVLPRKAVAEILRNPEAALRLVEEMAKRLSAAESHSRPGAQRSRPAPGGRTAEASALRAEEAGRHHCKRPCSVG